MAQTPVDRLVELSMVPELAKEVRSQIDGAASGGVEPFTITPLTGITGTANDAMTGTATITASTSSAATIVAPDTTFDAANVKTVVDAGLATANTNLLAAANQVVTKVNAELVKVNADLKDLQAKVNALIAGVSP